MTENTFCNTISLYSEVQIIFPEKKNKYTGIKKMEMKQLVHFF